MRKTYRIAALICGVLLFAGIFAKTESVTADSVYDNRDTGYSAVIEDSADLLTDREEEDLSGLMEEMTQYCNAAFVTIDYNPYNSAQSYAEHYSDSEFKRSSAVVFLVDMDNRMLWITGSGAAKKRITSSYADTITDNVYRYASKGDYYTCAYKAFSQINSVLRGQRIAQPMKYISNALLAIVLAMLFHFMLVKMTSGKRRASVREQISGIYSGFSVRDARAIFTNQTKRYSPKNSGGGGGGGGGGHSGGGGGGGHSGGGHSF